MKYNNNFFLRIVILMFLIFVPVLLQAFAVSAFDDIYLPLISSPKVNRLAFVSTRDGFETIHTMNADGTDVMSLHQDELGLNPDYSPDGQKIAFFSDCSFECGSTFFDIMVMNEDGSDIEYLTRSTLVREDNPDWSPDGLEIVYTVLDESDILNWQDIFVMNADGTNVRQLTNTPDDQELGPRWSPDGGQIVFYSNRDGDFDLYVMKADGTETVNLTNTPEFGESSPAWSPDGSRIAFVGTTFGCNIDEPPCEEVYTMSANGTDVVRLTNLSGLVANRPAWSPDGTQISFDAYGPDTSWESEIFIMDADGNNLNQITQGSGTYSSWGATWRP